MDPAQAYEEDIFNRHYSSRSSSGDSAVTQSYKGSTVLVTGGAGFLGKHLLEKLIRSCQIKKAYLILRSKKGKTIQNRLEDIVADPVFELLREKGIEYASKLQVIEGDMTDMKVGLKEADWRTLAEETEYIFHVAATVNFEETLKTATLTNVRGTREMIAFAKECRKLRSFVHVSTAYAHATYDRIGKDVKEGFYPTPISPELLIAMAENLNDGILNVMTPKLLRSWPNSYTFTKAVAEELMKEACKDLPISVVKPAIVINSYREPKPGYLDPSCIYGPSGLIVGGAYGVLHVFLSWRSVHIDLVPVDYVNNAIVLAGWAGAERHADRIYTVGRIRSSVDWGTRYDLLSGPIARSYMSPRAFWYHFMINTDSVVLYRFFSLILHIIPGFCIDWILWLMGKPTMAVKIYTKVTKLQQVLSYFLKNEWKFDDQNLLNLYRSLTPADQNLFFCNTADLVDSEHMTLWGLGVRKYILKDGLKETVYALKKQSWLKILNYIVFVLYFYTMWKIFFLFLYFSKGLFCLVFGF